MVQLSNLYGSGPSEFIAFYLFKIEHLLVNKALTLLISIFIIVITYWTFFIYSITHIDLFMFTSTVPFAMFHFDNSCCFMAG